MFHNAISKLVCSCTIESIFRHKDNLIIKNKNNYRGISSGHMIQFRDSQDNFAFFISLACHSSTSACFYYSILFSLESLLRFSWENENMSLFS